MNGERRIVNECLPLKIKRDCRSKRVDSQFDMSVSREITHALKSLETIWTKYRPEQTTITKETPSKVSFRKGFFVWECFTIYDDPRRPGTETRLAVVFVPSVFTFGSDFATMVRDHYTEQRVDHLVIIRKNESKVVTKILNGSGFVAWETLSYEDLQVSKLDYCLVPKYELVLGEDARNSVLSSMGILGKPLNMQRMLFRIDPIGRLLGFRAGEIVKVTRPDANTLENVSFRYVIDDATALTA